jgi:hypothetical protein
VATVKEAGVVVSLVGATLLNFKLEDPEGAIATKIGTLLTDGSDGKYFYTMLTTDLDQAGIWRIQGNSTLASGWTGHTTAFIFTVLDYLT